MQRTILSWLLLGALISLQAQPATYLIYTPAPLDALALYQLDSLQVYFNNLQAGGQPDQKGLLLATYRWQEDNQIQSVVYWTMRHGNIFSRDSFAWAYTPDTIQRKGYSLEPDERDHWEYVEDIDYSALDQADWPPFTTAFEGEVDTFIYEKGRLSVQRNQAMQSYRTYDEQWRIIEIKTVHPDRLAMGIGGHNWEQFTYDSLGNLIARLEIAEFGEGKKDTAFHRYTYGAAGNLLTHEKPIPSVPGASSFIAYQYEGRLMTHQLTKRSSFRSSGPPDYTRTPVSSQFETQYVYEEGRLVEEKRTHDGKPDVNGWIKYRYDEKGRLQQKILMDPFDEVPIHIYTYQYFPQP